MVTDWGTLSSIRCVGARDPLGETSEFADSSRLILQKLKNSTFEFFAILSHKNSKVLAKTSTTWLLSWKSSEIGKNNFLKKIRKKYFTSIENVFRIVYKFQETSIIGPLLEQILDLVIKMQR